MKVLIYGHSQAEPTGMGDDMVNALKKRKIEVKRVGRHSYNDKMLLDEVAKNVGDISGYDKVYLYAAGNNSKESDTKNLINYFIAGTGGDKVVFILPPLNSDREVKGMTLDQRRKALADKVEKISEMVPCYSIESTGSDFKKDEVHMRAGTDTGKKFVEKILSETLLESPTGGVVRYSRGVVAATALSSVLSGFLFVWWLYRKR